MTARRWLITAAVSLSFAAEVIGATLMFIIEHETEISFFNMEAYEEFKKNPEEKW
jgi:hypothetical protein